MVLVAGDQRATDVEVLQRGAGPRSERGDVEEGDHALGVAQIHLAVGRAVEDACGVVDPVGHRLAPEHRAHVAVDAEVVEEHRPFAVGQHLGRLAVELIGVRCLEPAEPELEPFVVIDVQEDVEGRERREGVDERDVILVRPGEVAVEDEPLACDVEGVGDRLLVGDAVEPAVELGEVVELDVELVVGRSDLEPGPPAPGRDDWARPRACRSGRTAIRPPARSPRPRLRSRSPRRRPRPSRRAQAATALGDPDIPAPPGPTRVPLK